MTKPREVDRVPIYNEVLKLLDADLDPRDILQISGLRLEAAMLVLLDMGLIERSALEKKLRVTQEGNFVASLQIGVFSSHLVSDFFCVCLKFLCFFFLKQ